MRKNYKAIFFDWDGTAVESRQSPVDEVVAAMKPLLKKKIRLVIVSGTTYDKIADGRLHTYFEKEELEYLYLGLGRGAYNYRFCDGEPVIFADMIPKDAELFAIHDICYAVHRRLLEEYAVQTDIVFSRPNYCKVDLMVENQRDDKLFMQGDEVQQLQRQLAEHGITGGVCQLVRIAEEEGSKRGTAVSATCDAKYLEIGVSCKSDNVDTILEELKKQGISEEDCCYWGDEYVGLEEQLFGSDSFMHTEKSAAGEFFDVSAIEGIRPEYVTLLGGGVKKFLNFLKESAN